MAAPSLGPAETAEPSADTLRVYVRDLIVHDDRDIGPGRGEYEIAIAVETRPGSAPPVVAQWKGSVSQNQRYDVNLWLGPVATPSEGGSLVVTAGGIERDPLVNDVVLGGISLLDAARDWGSGRWWRTVNGRHFDIVFSVLSGNAIDADLPSSLGTHDAPGPEAPTMAEYRAVINTGE